MTTEDSLQFVAVPNVKKSRDAHASLAMSDSVDVYCQRQQQSITVNNSVLCSVHFRVHSSRQYCTLLD